MHVVKNDDEEALKFFGHSETEKFYDVSFAFHHDADTAHALHAFIKKHNIQILVMRPHKHSWTEKLFQISETKDMIFHTHIPLLILPDSFT